MLPLDEKNKTNLKYLTKIQSITKNTQVILSVFMKELINSLAPERFK